MKINPTPLAAAMAAIWGVSTPRRIATALRFVTCPACRGIPKQLTTCVTCGGHLSIGVVG